jgi:hypothetical protein
MPKQYTLDIPEIAQPKRKVSPASQKINRKQAMANLRQIKRDIERGHSVIGDDGVPRTTLAIRQSRAQFLLTAIDDIMKGVEVAAAFNLEKPRGQAKKEERDIVIAMAIRELQNVGNSLDEAVKIVAGELALSEEAVLTSRKKGQRIASLIEKITPRSDSRTYRRHEPLIELLHGQYVKVKG